MTRPSEALSSPSEAGENAGQPWVEAFRARLPGWPCCRSETVRTRRACASWRPGGIRPGALAGFTGLQAIFSLGAGVDHLLADPNLPAVPIVRVVDPDLTDRMSEWVVLHVLPHHRQQARYRQQQRRSVWDDDLRQPAARDVRVGVMGLGVLGSDAALKLQILGFDVAGWSRTPKAVDGIKTFSGEQGLEPSWPTRRSWSCCCR